MSVFAPPVAVAPPPVTPPPPDPFAVEAILGAIGIRPFLDRSIRKVHGYHRDRAAATAADIERRIGRFLAREEPEPPADLVPFDFDEVRDQLAAPLTPDHIQQVMAAFGEDGEMALAVQLQVFRVIAYLKAHLPTRTRNTLAGPVEGEPPKSDVARFRRLWAIACDPLSVLSDLNEFNLSRDQAAGVFDLFPVIAASFWPASQMAMSKRKEVTQGKWEIPRRKENFLRILTRQEAPLIPLAQAIQGLYAAERAAPPLPSKKKARQPPGDDQSASEATAAEQLDR